MLNHKVLVWHGKFFSQREFATVNQELELVDILAETLVLESESVQQMTDNAVALLVKRC